MEEYIYTKKEAAALLGISLPTLDRLLRDGKIRKVKVSEKRVGITNVDLQAYIDGLKAKAGEMTEGLLTMQEKNERAASTKKSLEFSRKIAQYELLEDGTVALLDKEGNRIGRLVKE